MLTLSGSRNVSITLHSILRLRALRYIVIALYWVSVRSTIEASGILGKILQVSEMGIENVALRCRYFRQLGTI